jgi:nucleoside-diphosphate-sugar epimerase
MNLPTLLVTGATGFIGVHTVIELLTAGFNVLVLITSATVT